MFNRVRPAVRSLVPDEVVDLVRERVPGVTIDWPDGRQTDVLGRTSDRHRHEQQAAEPTPPPRPRWQRLADDLQDQPADALVATVRQLLEKDEIPTALAVAGAIGGSHGRLASAVVAASRGYDALAWSLLKDQPAPVWSLLAPEEFVRSGMATDRHSTTAAIRSLVDRAPDSVPAGTWLALVGPLFAYREYDLARATFDRLDRAVGDGTDSDRDTLRQRDWLRGWVNSPAEPATVPPAEGARASFAILDYKHPDRFRASANIGDHVQSLAALGHVVRHQQLEFTGPNDLTGLARRLQERVRPEVRRTDLGGTVDLYLAQRDGSHQDAFPEDTWALGFGWYMHPQWDISCDFGFHPNLRPIFVSFHVSRRHLLTPEAIDYLRQYAPIGCRDWTTVDLLLSAGVDAFFSGCMTTTVSNLFPDTAPQPPADAPWAYIDAELPADAENTVVGRQRRPPIRARSFVRNADDALAMLDSWRNDIAGLTTSRLHVYLPGRSIGARVDFRPKNPSDPRFTGLAPLDDAGFDRIRSTINDRLERVLGAALSGAPVDQVYALWRELNADDVAAAKDRLARPVQIAEPSYDLDAARAIATPAPTPAGAAGSDAETVQLAIRAHEPKPDVLRVLLGSVVAHTARPVHARILTRSPGALTVDELTAGLPRLQVSVLDTGTIAGRIPRPGGGWQGPAEVARFLTADLAGEVDRLIVLPPDAVVTADLAELAELDLGGRVIGAVRAAGNRHTSGYTVLLSAAQRLRDETGRSEEFRRIMHQRHAYDFPRFTAEVLVIDVQRWRSEQIGRSCLAWAEHFGLDFREALHAEFGPEHAELPGRWHRVPTRMPADDAALVHWLEKPRPWGTPAAPLAEAWLSASQQLRDLSNGW